MLYRKIGKISKEVSALGFGCMRFPVINGKTDQIDVEKAEKMLEEAQKKGVNYFDTAWPYHGEASEGFIGEYISKKDIRDEIYLATKLPSWLIKSEEDFDKYLDEQLNRLKTDTIDFYLIHTLNEKFWKNLLEHNLFDFIERAKAAGKIKHIGFSFHDELEMFKEIIDAYDGWEFCQIQLNFIDTDYQAGLEGMKYAKDHGLGVIVMEPLRGGNLVASVPKSVEEIWENSIESYTPVEWAFKYLYDMNSVDLVLSGMSTLKHVQENVKIASESPVGCLSDEAKATIKAARKAYLYKLKVNCTDCKYCMPCPYQVNIPRSLRFLNEYCMFDGRDEIMKGYLSSVKAENRADQCINCGVCLDKCPQKIDIPKNLEEANKLLECI